MLKVKQYSFLKDFKCIGDKCGDSCCTGGWGIAVEEQTYNKYLTQAPELLDLLDVGNKGEWIMQNNLSTDSCVQFDNGWCKTHKNYGEEFLSNCCSFFPRIVRQVGDEKIMTAKMSCPEIARLVISGQNPFALEAAEYARDFSSPENISLENLSYEYVLSIHQRFLDIAADNTKTSVQALLRIAEVIFFVEKMPLNKWGEEIINYINTEEKLPLRESAPDDQFLLLSSITGLLGATRSGPKPQRLDAIINSMAEVLSVNFNYHKVGAQMNTDDASYVALENLQSRWKNEWEAGFEPILHRWMGAQIAAVFFPFSGFGNGAVERIIIICVRFATLRLALMAQCQKILGEQKKAFLAEDDIVRIVQSLSRFFEHFNDPKNSMLIYNQIGWNKLARIRGLLEI